MDGSTLSAKDKGAGEASPAAEAVGEHHVLTREELIAKVRAYHPRVKSELLGAAYDFAKTHHGEQKRDSGDAWVKFGFYIMNNIGIAFQTFASGLLLGLGSLFFLLFNGLMIGAVAGHLTQIGYGQTFWSFVIGHGAFELTAIALAGAAGLKLGWALLAPGRLPRGEALRLAAARSVRLVGGVTLLLVLAAFVEAYWSSMTLASASVKYGVGAGLWLLVLAYLTLAGRGQHAPD